MSTWVCVASGPSLTRADCEKVAGLPTIVVNDSWKMVNDPAAILFAGDRAWWDNHHKTVPREGRECYTRSSTAARTYNLKLFVGLPGRFNSGQKAIELAAHLGASRVYLIGYDCSIKRATHWHGKHVGPNLKNPGPNSVRSWQGEFAELLHKVKLPPVYNCSRETELACFPKMKLEDALAQLSPKEDSCAV
jgi:hypothetical protein